MFGSFNGSITVKSSIFTESAASFGCCLYCNNVSNSFQYKIYKEKSKVLWRCCINFIRKTLFIKIHNSYFIHNVAMTKRGGSIWIEYSRLSIVNSSFHNNSAYTDGGAISCAALCIITVSHSNFTNNKAVVHNSSGGALFIERSTTIIFESCNFISSAFLGGALFLFTANLNAKATIHLQTIQQVLSLIHI